MTAYEWDFAAVFRNPGFWVWGAVLTFSFAVVTIALGLVIGIAAGTALHARRSWRNAAWRAPIYAYVQVFRCMPLLVILIWFYYALPILTRTEMPAWLAAGLALTLYMGAFSSEVVRGGIISISRNQWQAARSLGMTYGQMMRRVILPQALRRMVPPFVNLAILQLKNTSLLYVVAVPDLMYTASIIAAQSYRPLEVYTAVAVIYFLILFPLQSFAQNLEQSRDH